MLFYPNLNHVGPTSLNGDVFMAFKSVSVPQVVRSDSAGRSSKRLLSSTPPPHSAPSSAHQSVTTSPPSTRTPPSACAAVTLKSSSSTRSASCSEPTRRPPGSTQPTPTLCFSGSMASSWWHSIIRLMVSVCLYEGPFTSDKQHFRI